MAGVLGGADDATAAGDNHAGTDGLGHALLQERRAGGLGAGAGVARRGGGREDARTGQADRRAADERERMAANALGERGLEEDDDPRGAREAAEHDREGREAQPSAGCVFAAGETTPKSEGGPAGARAASWPRARTAQERTEV